MTDLIDQLDTPDAETWQQEIEGDLIVGTIVGFSTNTTDYGTYDIYILDQIEKCTTNGKDTPQVGPRAVHMLGKVRQDWHEDNQPTRGWRVAMRYDGRQRAKTTDRTFDAWKIAGEAPKGPVDQLAAETPAAGGNPFD